MTILKWFELAKIFLLAVALLAISAKATATEIKECKAAANPNIVDFEAFKNKRDQRASTAANPLPATPQVAEPQGPLEKTRALLEDARFTLDFLKEQDDARVFHRELRSSSANIQHVAEFSELLEQMTEALYALGRQLDHRQVPRDLVDELLHELEADLTLNDHFLYTIDALEANKSTPNQEVGRILQDKLKLLVKAIQSIKNRGQFHVVGTARPQINISTFNRFRAFREQLELGQASFLKLQALLNELAQKLGSPDLEINLSKEAQSSLLLELEQIANMMDSPRLTIYIQPATFAIIKQKLVSTRAALATRLNATP